MKPALISVFASVPSIMPPACLARVPMAQNDPTEKRV